MWFACAAGDFWDFCMRFDTSQQMKLSPRMIQSMEILQMPLAELYERLEQELESNPTMEVVEVVGEASGDGDGRVRIEEIVLGLNPTLEGDGTALYLAQELSGFGVKVTRLARGVPTGSSLEFANKAVLGDAILGRQEM